MVLKKTTHRKIKKIRTKPIKSNFAGHFNSSNSIVTFLLKARIKNWILKASDYKITIFGILLLLIFAFFIFIVSPSKPLTTSETIRGQTNILNLFGLLMATGFLGMIWRQHKINIPRGEFR